MRVAIRSMCVTVTVVVTLLTESTNDCSTPRNWDGEQQKTANARWEVFDGKKIRSIGSRFHFSGLGFGVAGLADPAP